MYNLHVFLSQSVVVRSRGCFKAERLQSHPKLHIASIILSYFRSLLLRLSGQIHTKLHKNGRPGEYPVFFFSKCEQLRKKTHVYKLHRGLCDGMGG